MDEETRLRFFSSEDQRWATPKWLFNRFDAVFHFLLDPCASAKTAKCRIFFTEKEDGLKQPWHRIGNAFVNPPFSKELSKWIKKAYEESTRGIVVCLLIPVRTDTLAWHAYCLPHANIFFIRGRITFEDQRDKPMEKLNPAFFPSALVVFGNVEGLDLNRLSDLGCWLTQGFTAGD